MGLFSWLFGGSRSQRRPENPPDGWRISEAGNDTFLGRDCRGRSVRATVFPDEKEGGKRLWKFVVTRIDADGFDSERHDPFYSDHYYSQSSALSDCKRFLSGQDLLERTYQQDRDERRSEEATASIPSLISSEQKRLEELQGRFSRGKSKREILLRDASKRLSQAKHYRDYVTYNGKPSQSDLLHFEKIITSYEALISKITQITPPSAS